MRLPKLATNNIQYLGSLIKGFVIMWYISIITYVTGFGKIGLNAASKIFYYFLSVDCMGSWDVILQNLEAAYSTSSLHPTHYNIPVFLFMRIGWFFPKPVTYTAPPPHNLKIFSYFQHTHSLMFKRTWIDCLYLVKHTNGYHRKVALQ